MRIAMIACVVLLAIGCEKNVERSKPERCNYFGAQLENYRAGKMAGLTKTLLAEGEEQCGVVVADKKELFLSAAKSLLAKARECFGQSKAMRVQTEVGKLSVTGCLSGSDVGLSLANEGCSNFGYLLMKREAFDHPKNEVRCLRLAVEMLYGLKLEDVIVNDASELSRGLNAAGADELLLADFREYRRSVCDAALEQLRDFPSKNQPNEYVMPKELGELVSECETEGGAAEVSRLVSLAYARKAKTILLALRAGAYEFPESRDKALELRLYLEYGNLRPEKLGTSEAEILALSLENPLVE